MHFVTRIMHPAGRKILLTNQIMRFVALIMRLAEPIMSSAGQKMCSENQIVYLAEQIMEAARQIMSMDQPVISFDGTFLRLINNENKSTKKFGKQVNRLNSVFRSYQPLSQGFMR